MLSKRLGEQLLLLKIPQVLIWGAQKRFVPIPLVEKYARAAKQPGDQVRLVIIPGAGHFETASPLSSTWPQVRSAILSLLGM